MNRDADLRRAYRTRDAVDARARRHRAVQRAARIRACTADDCGLLFIDTSRPGHRRWYSMERCEPHEASPAPGLLTTSTVLP
ncbi:CGNR zinc finger domain-containing protein [Nocardia sp. bgisy134]|uniref:CGNR zinc finger domain-containing protein n=1 Tax=unclassified Nocardia TaxID=2637762 RepID=UPI003D735A59